MRHSLARRRGTALVITLSIVVLLAFVLVAFFVKATSTLKAEKAGGGGREASLLAKSAVNLIVTDLQAEMKASSSPLGTNVWFPSTNQAMRPSRQLLAGVATNNASFFNLIKQSGVPMFAGSPTISTTGGTATSAPASDGRMVSVDRWSSPMLTGATLPVTPNWIYLNRDGSMAATPSAQTIGRFAYNVYDIGGLLDVNAAGFAPVSSGDPSEAATKGGQVWADLRSLPGINPAAYGNDASWPPQWRIPSDWSAMSSTNASSPLAWYQASGWLQPYAQSGGAGVDRMFTSRQDLIRYAQMHESTFDKDAAGRFPALQYLTTFSREVDQPTFRPSTTRPKIDFDENQGGNDSKGLDDEINPGVRASDGRALVKKRFALDNLKLLASASPDAAEIYRLFGLTRSGNKWVYNHGTAGQILNLGGIPSDREPDFFEILKAAIHAGSLGVQHGTSLSISPIAFYRPSLGYDDASLNYQIIQIGANIIDQGDENSYPTQIEFDGTTFAGVENLPYIDAVACVSLPEQVISGLNPPVDPSGVNFVGIGDWADAGGKVKSLRAVTLLMPRLWNPHAGNPGNQTQVPVNFRVRAEISASGTSPFVQARHTDTANTDFQTGNPWRTDGVDGGSGNVSSYKTDYTSIGGQNYGPTSAANPALNLNGSAVQFSLATGWQASFPNTLSDPRILSHLYSGSGFSSITGTAGVTEFSSISPWIQNGFGKTASATALVAPYEVFGFPMGRSWMGPYVQNSAGTQKKPLFSVIEVWSGPVRLILECQTSSGDWIPYDEAYYLTFDVSSTTFKPDSYYALTDVSSAAGDGDRGNLAVAIDGQAIPTYLKFDARSKRWGGVMAGATFLGRGTKAQQRLLWQYQSIPERGTLRPGATATLSLGSYPQGVNYYPTASTSFDAGASGVWSAAQNHTDFKQLATANIANVAVNTGTSPAGYEYLDPDRTRRRGMGAYWIDNSFDGQPLANESHPTTGAAQSGVARNRPIILNRPFRSVAELGYVFRDTPWRNLDFFTAESGDSALLDFFCIHRIAEDSSGRSAVPLTNEGAPIVGGKINLNTLQSEVLTALLRGTARENQGASTELLSEAEARTIAEGLVNFTSSTAADKGPFTSLADLVGRPGSAPYRGFADELTSLLPAADTAVKQRREAVVRALTDAGGVRTWTVLIDVVAQSGIVPPGTTRFIPRGESRIWTSTAVDRFTAEVLDSQSEWVNE